jgi:hypothetical protein
MLWLEKCLPEVSFEFQRDHQNLWHRRYQVARQPLSVSSHTTLSFWLAVQVSAVAVWFPENGSSPLHIVPSRKYELSCDKDRPALFSKTGFLRFINIHFVHFVVSNFWKHVNVNSSVPGGVFPTHHIEIQKFWQSWAEFPFPSKILTSVTT